MAVQNETQIWTSYSTTTARLRKFLIDIKTFARKWTMKSLTSTQSVNNNISKSFISFNQMQSRNETKNDILTTNSPKPSKSASSHTRAKLPTTQPTSQACVSHNPASSNPCKLKPAASTTKRLAKKKAVRCISCASAMLSLKTGCIPLCKLSFS